jgi:hypothetical protein
MAVNIMVLQYPVKLLKASACQSIVRLLSLALISPVACFCVLLCVPFFLDSVCASFHLVNTAGEPTTGASSSFADSLIELERARTGRAPRALYCNNNRTTSTVNETECIGFSRFVGPWIGEQKVRTKLHSQKKERNGAEG